MSLQWLNQCKCERGNHNTVMGNCIARNIKGTICDDCAKNCGGLTLLAVDFAKTCEYCDTPVNSPNFAYHFCTGRKATKAHRSTASWQTKGISWIKLTH